MTAPTIVRGTFFRDYDTPGLDRFEVSVSEGVITMLECHLPDEMTAWQSRSVAAMLAAAADELEAGNGG